MGSVLVGGALLCLWANEGRFDYHAAAAKARVIGSPGQAMESHAIAYTRSLEPVSFAGDYVTQFEDFLTVHRIAEIYCWKKKRRERWEKEWSRSLNRNHRNDGLSQTLSSRQLKAKAYHLGDLEISPRKLHFADDERTLSPSSLPLSEQGQAAGLKIANQYFYLRKHPGAEDQLGDERMKYVAVPAAKSATYFGSIRDQVGTAKVFEEKSGIVSVIIKDDGILHHLVNGNRDAALATLKGHIQRLRWMVRGIGSLVSMTGVAVILSPLIHLFMGVPVLGRLVRGGVKLISILVGGFLAIVTMGASWLAHHPVIAMLVILVLSGAGFWLSILRKRSTNNASKVMERLETTSFSASDDSTEKNIKRPEHVFQHLVKIAVADGNFDQTENTFLANWARERKIPDERIEALFNEAKGDHELHPMDATREDLYYLISLSLADGHLSAKELQRIQRFARDLKIDDDELESLIAVVRRGQLAEDTNQATATQATE